MPRGGARPNSGPAKDPNSLRSMKLAEKNGRKVLPLEYKGEVPEWPLPNVSPRHLELWAQFWTLPQAHIWAANRSQYSVAIHVQTCVEAEQPGAATSTRTMQLQQQNALYLTGETLAKGGYAIADSDDGLSMEPAKTTARRPTSSRTRLRAVPNVSSEP